MRLGAGDAADRTSTRSWPGENEPKSDKFGIDLKTMQPVTKPPTPGRPNNAPQSAVAAS